MEILQWVMIIAIVAFILYRFLPVRGVENLTVQELKEKIARQKYTVY